MCHNNDDYKLVLAWLICGDQSLGVDLIDTSNIFEPWAHGEHDEFRNEFYVSWS